MYYLTISYTCVMSFYHPPSWLSLISPLPLLPTLLLCHKILFQCSYSLILFGDPLSLTKYTFMIIGLQLSTGPWSSLVDTELETIAYPPPTPINDRYFLRVERAPRASPRSKTEGLRSLVFSLFSKNSHLSSWLQGLNYSQRQHWVPVSYSYLSCSFYSILCCTLEGVV